MGISLSSPSDYKLIKIFKFDFVQVNFNLMDQRILKDFKKNHSYNFLLARTVLNFGMLTNYFFEKKGIFNKLDHRSRWSGDQIELWKYHAKNYYEMFAANNHKMSLQQSAVKFCLSFKNCPFVNIGVMSKKEIDDFTVPYVFKPFSEKMLIQIKKYYNSNSFIIKSLKPSTMIRK